MRFKRRRNVSPEVVIQHLVPVTTHASLDGSDEALERAADHLVKDLDGLTRAALIRVASLALMCEGDAQAERIKTSVKSFAAGMMADLQAHLDAEGPETAAERPANAEAAPEDPEPENGDESPAQAWAEDRR